MSVVIPVKDDARKLRHCLAALDRQDTAPHEVIVVDNASVDDSAAIARAAGARVLFESRIGIGIASATGYDHATGDIIARLDADSVPGPTWVATLGDAFATDPGLDAITGAGRFNDGPAVLRWPAFLVYLVPYFILAGLALGHVPLFGSNMAFRTALWLEVRDGVHLDDRLVHDDLDLSFHLRPGHRIRFSRRLDVRISLRPFSDGHALLRLRRGFHTIFLHWPADPPWRRFGNRAASRWREPDPRPRGPGH